MYTAKDKKRGKKGGRNREKRIIRDIKYYKSRMDLRKRRDISGTGGSDK